MRAVRDLLPSGDWRRAYANYLVQYARFYAQEGITINDLGFTNEPNWTTSYSTISTGTASPYLTNGSASMTAQPAVAIGGGAFTATVPARSLVTYVIRGCGAPWPCPTRRRELRAEYADAPVSLALYLGAQLVRASQDLTWAPAGTLRRRFLGWLR